MGKSIDDLPLDDREIVPEDLPDRRTSDWYAFLQEIEALLDTGRFTWAQATLEGIHATVEQTRRVSDAQRRAVENIEAGSRKSRGREKPNYFRRYR